MESGYLDASTGQVIVDSRVVVAAEIQPLKRDSYDDGLPLSVAAQAR